MTKRFDIDDSDIVVDDLETGESYIFDDYRSCENCCILLNELHEENQELKQEMGNLGTAHAEEINKIEDRFDEEILKLEKENEQLKSENKKLNERIGILEGSLIDKGFDIND